MSDSPLHPAERSLRANPAFLHIPFTPVPVKARHDGWTPARQRGFIDRMTLVGCVAICARAVGKTPQSAYKLRNHPQAASFRAAWDRALQAGWSYQRDIAFQRAFHGEKVPVTYRGRVIATRVRYNDSLAIAVLNARHRRPGRSTVEDALATLEDYIDQIAPRPATEK